MVSESVTKSSSSSNSRSVPSPVVSWHARHGQYYPSQIKVSVRQLFLSGQAPIKVSSSQPNLPSLKELTGNRSCLQPPLSNSPLTWQTFPRKRKIQLTSSTRFLMNYAAQKVPLMLQVGIKSRLVSDHHPWEAQILAPRSEESSQQGRRVGLRNNINTLITKPPIAQRIILLKWRLV